MLPPGRRWKLDRRAGAARRVAARPRPPLLRVARGPRGPPHLGLAGAPPTTARGLGRVGGGEPRRLTSNPASDSRPRFSPDGRTLAFLSTRDGSPQVWAIDLAGGEPRRLSSLATGVDAFEWLGASRLAPVSEEFPGCGADDACNAKRLGDAGKPSSARGYAELLYRHWDTWDD